MDTTNDNGYIFCLTKNYHGFGGNRGDIWIIKTDENGNTVWNQIFGGPKEDRGYYISKTNDGGYIVAGRTESYGNGGSDGILIKISPDKEIPRHSLQINKPKIGHIYLFDIIGIPFPFLKEAILLGDITFKVDVNSEDSTISKVEYFVNDTVTAEVTEQPFSYTWTVTEPDTYHIKVRVYNSWGGTDQKTLVIRKII